MNCDLQQAELPAESSARFHEEFSQRGPFCDLPPIFSLLPDPARRLLSFCPRPLRSRVRGTPANIQKAIREKRAQHRAKIPEYPIARASCARATPRESAGIRSGERLLILKECPGTTPSNPRAPRVLIKLPADACAA